MNGRLFFPFEFFREIAGNGFKQVFHGCHTQYRTKLVYDEGVIRTALPKELDCPQRSGTVGQYERLAQCRLNVEFPCFEQLGKQVFFIDITQRFVNTCLTDNKQAAVRRILQLGILFFPALGNIQTLNVAPRNHDARNRTLGKR